MREEARGAAHKVKKIKKTAPVRYSKTPPPGWPTEKQWKEIERRIADSRPTKAPPENAGPVAKAKYDLCEHFIMYHRDEMITQREMAERLGVTESRVSEILHYHIERFTIDKLLELLAKIRPDVKIQVA